MTAIDELALEPAAVVPVPSGRGRWRVTLHSRVFVGAGYGAASSPWQSTILAELSHARGRRLELDYNAGATLTFTIDGRDPIASSSTELMTDVYAWRWDEYRGADVCKFHGVIDHGQDVISEQEHSIVYGAHDYAAMLDRRRIYGTNPISYTNVDQDSVVEALVRDFGVNTVDPAAGPYSFLPGSYLPLHVVMANPDGSARAALSGRVRTRLYQPGAQISSLIGDLAAVIQGFDFDVQPAPAITAGYNGPTAGPRPANVDALRVFYPVQGITRTDIALVYGGNVATVSRTVSSAEYANRILALGNNGSSDPAAPKLIADRYNADASGQIVGLFDDGLNASDVSQQATLNEQAAGALALEGSLVPSYALTLRPGAYRDGFPNLGDVVPIIVQSGRLAVEDDQRVVGIAFDIGEDGDETVEVTLGRPPTTFGSLFRTTRRQIAALNRK